MHAFSGCDTVSSFCGIGKKTVWDTWRSLPSLTTVFGCLSHIPEAISDNHMIEIERFVVLLYSRTSQHVKCVSFQAGYIWRQALIPNPSPGDWGWKKDADGRWTPLWTTLSEASKQCRGVIKCNCKKQCFGGSV